MLLVTSSMRLSSNRLRVKTNQNACVIQPVINFIVAGDLSGNVKSANSWKQLPVAFIKAFIFLVLTALNYFELLLFLFIVKGRKVTNRCELVVFQITLRRLFISALRNLRGGNIFRCFLKYNGKLPA